MVRTFQKKDERTGIINLEIDKRTLPKKKPHNVKDLNFARNLPPECNGCPFRPIEKGGNGICTEYKEDSLCVIRKDIATLVDKYGGRTLDLMEVEFHNNFEKLMFFEKLEDYKGELNPEVTKRINSLNNLGKVINEIKTKRETVEVTEKTTLSQDEIHEIARTVKLTKEIFDES